MLHKYKLFDLAILLDSESGSVHVIDDVVFDVLDEVDENLNLIGGQAVAKYGKESVDAAIKSLLDLKEQGLLFCVSENEEDMPREQFVKALCLHVAHSCNLACDYCFAQGGNFGGKHSLMPFEVGKAAIDFVISKSGTRRNIEVDLFGGEPLMNFDAVKQIVEYAKVEGEKHKKNFRFTITTNGLLLDDDIIAYINANMDNIVLSLDGRKAVNDKHRVTRSGSGSYDTIVPKIKQLIDGRTRSYYVRGTFTRDNLDFTQDVQHMVDLGFRNLSIEPAVGKDDICIKRDQLPQVFAEYEKLTHHYLDNYDSYSFFHLMVDLDGGPCSIKRASGCGAGSAYLAVTPSGDIYPCHQFVGIDSYRMGNILSGEYAEMDEFARCNIHTKQKCRDCWAKYYCSGGCHANNYHANGDIFAPDELACELTKKRTECAIYIYCKRQLED